MTSTQSHFGAEFESNDYTVNRTDIDGIPLFCIGINKHSPHSKWYGYIMNGIRINPSHLSFCESCGIRNFTKDEVFEITHEEYPNIIKSLICDTPHTDICRNRFGIDRRCIHKQGMRITINAIEKDSANWKPLMTIPTEKGKTALLGGVGIYAVPSMTYWECVIRGDRNGKYNKMKNIYFKIKKAHFGDGRVVFFTNQHGNSNFYTPIRDTLLIINSYKTGVSGQRFFYAKPSEIEKEHKLEASHNEKSNILYITLSVCKKTLIKEPDEYIRGRSCDTPKSKSGPTSKSGSTSYSGGSNFAADGYSSNIKTHKVNATFDEIETVDIIIQLVNNQSDVELERLSREAQQQVERSKEDEITKLMVERNIIDGKIDELRRNFGIDPRTSILSQDKLLL